MRFLTDIRDAVTDSDDVVPVAAILLVGLVLLAMYAAILQFR